VLTRGWYEFEYGTVIIEVHIEERAEARYRLAVVIERGKHKCALTTRGGNSCFKTGLVLEILLAKTCICRRNQMFY
jgi:hypothetical protein